MLTIETLHTFDTIYSADSVEWHNGDDNLFAVGTYQLELEDETVSANNTRIGRIYLFHYDDENDLLKECHRIETDAVLDQKWCGSFLLTATSAGTIQSYKINANHQLDKIEELLLSPESDALALCVDVTPRSPTKIVSSDSKGRLHLLDFEAGLKVITQWTAHEFEAWTCCFCSHNDNVIFSGGDDSRLKIWDIRTNSDAVLNKSKSRDSGVTSIMSQNQTLLVGGYDEKLCAYDLRRMKEVIDEINLHGGVWRIKASKKNPHHFLLACMYHNFSIVEFKNKFQLIGEYSEHKSICYGCDWSSKMRENSEVFASCSFYDHKLSICRAYDSIV